MRDYAKKSYRPVQENNHSNSPWILILLVISAIGFISTLTYHFIDQKSSAKKEVAEAIAPIPSKTTSVEKSTAKIKHKQKKTTKKIALKKENVIKAKKEAVVILNPADEEPKYDFYKLLPETTVKIPPQDPTAKLGTAL
ncbi:MAG: hypothetical protein NTZ67_07285 [Gammaproteobacteria bacterium]|nr:hypothetical protein [Gammaproteobacteria bacterium]